MKKFIFGLIGVIFASVMALSLSSCGEDLIEEIDKEQVDDEKEETGKETSQIVGVWKKGSGRTTIKFKDDGTGYTEHNGDFEWFAYTFNSKTNVVDRCFGGGVAGILGVGDADDFTVHVKQCTAGIARVDCGIDLDQIGINRKNSPVATETGDLSVSKKPVEAGQCPAFSEN